MNWDQIETNWAAMTRRVRPERPAAGISGTAPQPGPAAADEPVTNSERIPAEISSSPRQVA
ncbi:MAG: hypothetical protein Q8S30_09515 [Frigidibacter sp.]|nr:hypothetical protein [Frigidibacter sp.]